MNIENVIDLCDDGKDQERNFDLIEGFMVHRCGVDLKSGIVLGYDAVRVCDAFRGKDTRYPEVAKATGGQIAYSILIGGDLGPPEFDGRIWQCLPLDEVGHHGRRFSRGWLGIGLIADPRVKAISKNQRASLTMLLSELCVGWVKDPLLAIKGHGEVPEAGDGTKAPGKPDWCPGFDMQPIRDEVYDLVRELGRRVLYDSGLVFSG